MWLASSVFEILLSLCMFFLEHPIWICFLGTPPSAFGQQTGWGAGWLLKKSYPMWFMKPQGSLAGRNKIKMSDIIDLIYSHKHNAPSARLT